MRKHFSKILILAAFLAILDQISKWLVIKYLTTPYILIEKILKFEYSQNTGIAFGIPIPYYILIALTILLIIFVIYFTRNELDLDSPISRISMAFIIGGALGNLIDRLANGYVVDFISVWKWPNFNFADSLVTIGILLLIIFYGKIKKLKKIDVRRK